MGSAAANVGGNGTLTFRPDMGSAPAPGPITVDTGNAPAIVITGNAQLAINPIGSSFPTTITTTGPNAYGIDVVSGGHTKSLNNVFINASGVNSDGIRIENPNNTIDATNVTATTTGAGASALALLSGGGSLANFTNSTLTSAAGPVIRFQGGSGKTINLTGTSVTAGNSDGRWLYVTGGASGTNIATSNSTLTGAAITDPGSTSNLMLTNGTVWDVTGSSNVTNLTNNASQIDFAAGGAFKTLTTVNYTGAGGTIGLNTFLGVDSSPSDQLIIGGAGTGNTFVHVTNAGGPGAETTANGIPVVVTTGTGTTAPGAFTLANPELRAGAFTYELFRGGLSPSNFPNDWFLRNTFEVNGNGENGNGNGGNGNGGKATEATGTVGTATEATGTVGTATEATDGNGGNGNGNGNGGNGGNGNGGAIPPLEEMLPNRPPPDPLPPGVLFPIIGPELATYGVVQPLARQLGLSTLGTLDDRVGDTYESDGCAVAPAPETSSVDLPTRKNTLPTRKPAPAPCPLFAPSVWGRFFGQTVNNHYQAFADPRASGNLGGFQGGIDLLRGSLIAGHSERAGLYGAYGNVNSDVTGLVTNPAATA